MLQDVAVLCVLFACNAPCKLEYIWRVFVAIYHAVLLARRYLRMNLAVPPIELNIKVCCKNPNVSTPNWQITNEKR
jgi:hypothetical protein